MFWKLWIDCANNGNDLATKLKEIIAEITATSLKIDENSIKNEQDLSNVSGSRVLILARA